MQKQEQAIIEGFLNSLGAVYMGVEIHTESGTPDEALNIPTLFLSGYKISFCKQKEELKINAYYFDSQKISETILCSKESYQQHYDKIKQQLYNAVNANLNLKKMEFYRNLSK